MTRTVLVTGGTSGIGRAIAARFAADQAEVLITGRNPDTVEAAARELGVHGAVCDATDTVQVAELAARLDEVDVLINAAGGLSQPVGDGTSLDEVLALWHANLAQNLLSAVLTTASVQDRLTRDSSVVSIGSIGAERRGGSYGAAKAALGAWNATLSAELAPAGVTCNIISAGYIAGTNFFRGGLSDERRRALVEETHNKRPGTVDDIAQTAHFLASPGARHITGQTVHVNGGAFTTR
ncbi:3-oxoacyl-ACP reductase [Streptomyces viridochromogenes]|uniref:3-oxoacyl-ACP reductase n=1 Tax=Streptomyces viridochromogenes TaxID=1938 RepID=A0A0J8C5G9_STRVR|nr:SDR family oxidoreductase [Streptomyces viridochromogenes]KMS73075.1 3-oxoacyl-ACP reductase [Streptomyces viridochromogenes]KOG11766.1 3-oxoacyl-ACP reductase [Streptomyces viridochromogenes]KOG24027.1 3-oxoacyl-ACP reductase [Streptomyces viridochromogenes]